VEHFYVNQDYLKFRRVLIELNDYDQWVLDYYDVKMNDEFVQLFFDDFETKYLNDRKKFLFLNQKINLRICSRVAPIRSAITFF
jgi:6-pyruvoyl-tetrahydropterin synthase